MKETNQTYEERHNFERLKEMDAVFRLHRHIKKEIEIVDHIYLDYKQELINIQRQYTIMRKYLKEA